MSMRKLEKKVYDDGRTKQAFKNQCDINTILKKAQKTGAISHLAKHEASYGDFTGFDFFEAQMKIAKATEIFDELPSEIRREFNNEPRQFFEYANKDESVGRMAQLLPKLAEPGDLKVAPVRTAATEAAEDAQKGGKEKEVAKPPIPAKEPEKEKGKD